MNLKGLFLLILYFFIASYTSLGGSIHDEPYSMSQIPTGALLHPMFDIVKEDLEIVIEKDGLTSQYEIRYDLFCEKDSAFIPLLFFNNADAGYHNLQLEIDEKHYTLMEVNVSLFKQHPKLDQDLSEIPQELFHELTYDGMLYEVDSKLDIAYLPAPSAYIESMLFIPKIGFDRGRHTIKVCFSIYNNQDKSAYVKSYNVPYIHISRTLDDSLRLVNFTLQGEVNNFSYQLKNTSKTYPISLPNSFTLSANQAEFLIKVSPKPSSFQQILLYLGPNTFVVLLFLTVIFLHFRAIRAFRLQHPKDFSYWIGLSFLIAPLTFLLGVQFYEWFDDLIGIHASGGNYEAIILFLMMFPGILVYWISAFVYDQMLKLNS